MSGVKVTFNVKDQHENILGVDALVDEFSTNDFNQGVLNGVQSTGHRLTLQGQELVPEWHSADAQTVYDASSSSVNINKPTNLEEGDLIVAFVMGRMQSVVTPPSGFTLIRYEGDTASSLRTFVATYYKIATHDEPATYAFGFSASSYQKRIVVGRVTNFVASAPIDQTSGATGSANNIVIPELEATAERSLMLAAACHRSSTTVTVPSEMAELFKYQTTTYASCGGASELLTKAGPAGSRRFAFGASYNVAGQMFNVRGGTRYEESGYRISPPVDLSSFGNNAPDLRIRWRHEVPAGTSMAIETAITDSDTDLPDESDWEVQTNWSLLTNSLPADLSGYYLRTRVRFETTDEYASPILYWLVVYDDSGEGMKVAARVELEGEAYRVDGTGTAEAVNIEPAGRSEQIGPAAPPESNFHSGDYGLRFRATEWLKLHKATIRSQAAGEDIYQLWAYDRAAGENPLAGKLWYEKIVELEAGLNEVVFNWEVPPGAHYWIGRPEGLLGATRDAYAFPAIGSVVGIVVENGERSIGGDAANWYYLYNLHVDAGMPFTVHVMPLDAPYRYQREHDFAIYLEESDISVDASIKTIKVDLTNLGFQVEQVLVETNRVDITSLGFQVEISEPIIIDFEGYGIESREQVSSSDFVILGTTATGISVFPASLNLAPGSLAVIQATVRPPNAADRDVIWSTSNYSVVSVVGDGERGTIRGHAEGTATITAVSRDGGYLATCQVVVEEKGPVPYEALKILQPNFSEIVTLDNTEIVDLTITKELSGHYGVEFTLPVGVTGWEEIRRGRYVETEGQRFTIEQIRPVRQSDGIPLLQVTCSHVFFEIERVNMPHDTTARSTIQDHVNYVLRNTGFVMVATDKENPFYQIDRVIGYSASDSRFAAFQRIFQVFGGHYRLNDFTVEIIPPRPTPPTSAVVLEYAVTNAAIEKHEDDADVITTLYATGGQVDGVPLERVVQADPEIRALYRKERVRFVNFGDIRVWNNFVYVTDQYLEKRQLPRTTYSLSVAELKRINGIENLYPERDFELDIGKVVQVKDTDLGIDTQKLLQRYTYKPLQPDHLSSVIVGDKPFDIAFTETSREGVVQEEEGEWRYDEGTREWIFFPANPIIEDDTGEDYTLTITEHPSSCGPAGIRYRYHTGEDRPEKSTLTIKEGASASGKVIVILDTEIYSVEIEEGDIPEMVAVKIAGADYPGWETEQADNVVVFTAKRVGAKRYSADYRFGLTGAIGGFVTVKGAQEAFISDWKDAELPFEQTFNEGDEVQVIARSDSKWYSLVDWTGDGEGFSPRLYIMDSNQSSQVRFASTAGAIDVRTRTPSYVTEESAVLQGEILDPSKFGSVERGFVWAYTSNPTLSSNEGQIWAGTGGKGSFSAAFHQPVGDPYDQRYYYRAYAKAYDQECQREMVAYGITRSFTFAYEDYAVEVVVMTIDDIELDAPVNIQPGEGVFSYASGSNVTLEIESASLPEGATFERWLIIDQQTGTFESVTENPYSFEVVSNYRIAAVIARPAMVLWVNQEEGTGVIQIADSPDGPRTAWRLGFAMRFDRTVYVWTVPDDESQQGKWTEDSGGVGEEPRVFALGETFVEYRATVRWSPLHVCEKRCIFISPDDPDPTVGVDGNIWLKYRE